MALKLVKRIFQPNERLGADPTHQCLHVIGKGKADLQLSRLHYNKSMYKTLRVINANEGKGTHEVSNNLVGLTAVLLRRPVDLTALSR